MTIHSFAVELSIGDPGSPSVIRVQHQGAYNMLGMAGLFIAAAAREARSIRRPIAPHLADSAIGVVSLENLGAKHTFKIATTHRATGNESIETVHAVDRDEAEFFALWNQVEKTWAEHGWRLTVESFDRFITAMGDYDVAPVDAVAVDDHERIVDLLKNLVIAVESGDADDAAQEAREALERLDLIPQRSAPKA